MAKLGGPIAGAAGGSNPHAVRELVLTAKQPYCSQMRRIVR
jgi:hypothetical protein